MGLAFALVVSASTTNIIPGVTAVTGEKLWQKDVQFVQDLGVLDDGEPILVYYSMGLFSHREDGNIVTDRRLLSYAAGEGGETIYWSATYDEIISVHIFYSDSFWSETEVLACTEDAWFGLFAGSEGKGENLMVSEIVRRVGPGRVYTHAYDTEVACEDSGAV